MTIDDLKALKDKIWRRIRVGNKDECWVWDGAYVQGCATIYHEGKSHYVSRYIYMFANNDFNVKERAIRHTCRNKKCCNPSHLVLGAQREKAPFDLDKLKRKYLSRVITGSENECWNWKSNKREHGYGWIMCNGAIYLAHRLAYMFRHPEFDIKSKELVFHACGNRLCCNPSHLFLKSDIRGENNMNVKLTKEQVIEIRQIFSGRKIKKKTLAEMYDVSVVEIFYVLERKRWDWLKNIDNEN